MNVVSLGVRSMSVKEVVPSASFCINFSGFAISLQNTITLPLLLTETASIFDSETQTLTFVQLSKLF